MKFFLFFFLFVTIVTGTAFAQDSVVNSSPDFPDSSLIVESILIKGNAHTKDFVILREMTLHPGALITHELIEYDKNRIYSLGLFNLVKLEIIPSKLPNVIIFVEVSERWYLFPFPIFGIRDHDWGKAYYGVGLLHNNFRGRNEKLALSLVFGYDPSVSLSYRNPFLDDEGSSFFEGKVSYNKVRNKSISAKIGAGDFDEKHFQLSESFGKRFGIEHTAWASIGYEIVDISGVTPSRTLTPDGIDRFPVFGMGYMYDTRDLAEYPGYGTFLSVTATKYGIPSQDINVVRYAGDYRRYIPLMANIVLTSRVFTNLSAAGKVPNYNHVYFGYDERIRGHFKEIREGEQLFGFTSELHYPLISPRYFVVNFLPREFGVWKFGVYAALFFDAGTVWFRGKPFALDTFSKGYGAGLHFLLPYGMVMRTEYGFNEARRGEFILDFGTSF